MRLLGSTLVLTLAWFLVASAAGSLAAWMAATALRRRSDIMGRGPSAAVLLGVRLLPVTIALLVAVGMFLPVHWVNEPREGTERFGLLLPALAVAALLLIGRRLVQVQAALRATRDLRRAWIPTRLAHSESVVHDRVMVGVSLAGVFRTTIVVGLPVRDTLTTEELDVAIAHEVAHRHAWDNAKRFAMMASPDLFGSTGVGRWLEQRWSTEVECEADADAARGDARRAAALASALVKVARLASAPAAGAPRVAPLWSTFHDQSILELRVRRLVAGAAVPRPPSTSGLGPWLALAAGIASAWTLGLPAWLQVFSEVLVQRLP